MGTKKGGSQWISLSDMMTWLMLVFLLISILVISKIQEEEKEKNRILLEYSNVKNEIYKDLKKAFEEKEQEWDMTIEEDLTIKFSENEIWFWANSSIIPVGFQSILNEFTPEYLSIINADKYSWKIKEVRIEGHAWKCNLNQYWVCLNLSQQRANSVMQYIFNHNSYYDLAQNKKNTLKFIFTSNGMSDWKNLDSSWEYVYKSKKELDSWISRRVEFRIVTNSEELVGELLNKIK